MAPLGCYATPSVVPGRATKMAGATRGFARLLERHKATIVRDLEVAKLLPTLTRKGIFTTDEERRILGEKSAVRRSELFLDILSTKGFGAFQEFCLNLEQVSPHLLTSFLLDNAAAAAAAGASVGAGNSAGYSDDNLPSSPLQQLGLQLALQQRNSATAMRENNADRDAVAAWRRCRQMKGDRNRAVTSLENINRSSTASLGADGETTNWSVLSTPRKSRESVAEQDMGGERVVWEFHTVALSRMAGYGFGIAVSGGRDNPHFSNGDPAIVISDVLKAGPAEGKLQINDQVISANGVPLDNVSNETAVQVLRDCGLNVTLIIKRKVVLPSNGFEANTLRITLMKNKKKDDFGIILGCRIYVKEVTNKNMIEKSSGLMEGDIITKINNTSTENMTLKEAKKLVDGCKEKLQLVVRREPPKVALDNIQRLSLQNLYDSNHANTNKYETNPPPNFIDISDTRPYSNQNLYVQPPTRADMYRSPPPVPDSRTNLDEKNNLTRMTSRSRGPILDISLSQLDQPATPLLHGHSRALMGASDDEEPPPRPPPPRMDNGSGRPSSPGRDRSHLPDYYASRRDLYSEDPLARKGKQYLPDPRFISFQKEGSVGIRLIGGNDVGIFVTAVQSGSPASIQGLQPGDKILKVNNLDMKDITREEAVLYLLSLQDRIDLIVQYRKDEYDTIAVNQRGDSFYIRAHFNYENVTKGEMSFRVGDIFHVVDTMHNGVVGSWQVYRMGRNNQETQKGIIPTKNRAEELAADQLNMSKKESSSESRGSFFKRRSARRSKLLTDSTSKYPAYERVTLRHPGFTRPVILFGPLSDVSRDKLFKDHPDKFASPQLDGHYDDGPKNQKSSGIVRLSAIKEIIDRQGKHAVIDITPNAVDRLNYAQFYPIVIFLRADNKHVIKELRGRSAKSSSKSSKKLFDHSIKLEKNWSHIFTATITLTSADTYYKKIKESIEKQQQQPIWMSETKPEEPITDDFLFPMTSRLSYASSPESDLDLATESHHCGLLDSDANLFGERRLVKASSDPSIATQEEVGLPSYNGPPPYSAGPYQRQQNFDGHMYEEHLGNSHKRHSNEPKSDERQSHNLHPDENRNERNDCYSSGYPKNDLYNAMPNEHYPNRMNGDISDTYNSKGWTPGEPELPPRVDRASKPSHLRTAQERLFGANQRGRGDASDVASPGMGNYINTNKHTPKERQDMKAYGFQGSYESSSYSGDSYSKFPAAVIEEMKMKERYNQQMMQNRSSHDPYRFTRSTALPVKAMAAAAAAAAAAGGGGVENEKRSTKPNESPSKYRTDYKPVPPPKSPNYKPVPPPKPKNYRSPTVGHPAENYWNREDVPPPPPPTKPPDSMPNHGRNVEYAKHNSYAKSYSSMESNHQLNSMNTSEQYMYDRYNSQKGKFEEDSGGFDSGQGSSLDRNYDTQTYVSKPLSPSSRGYYYNVPPPRDLGFHGREPSGLDLSNRENRGSAFELYKKPDSRSPAGLSPLTVNVDSMKEETQETSESPSTSIDNNNVPELLESIDETTHTVVATARGTFTDEGGCLESPETGVSILIPKGAIPEGVEQEIYFKVCHDKNMLPPLDKSKGETLLSPLVMCGPHGLKFGVPVELHLPHCASVNPDSWSFALKSSDTSTGFPTRWHNVSLANLSNISQNPTESSSVSVLVDHF